MRNAALVLGALGGVISLGVGALCVGFIVPYFTGPTDSPSVVEDFANFIVVVLFAVGAGGILLGTAGIVGGVLARERRLGTAAVLQLISALGELVFTVLLIATFFYAVLSLGTLVAGVVYIVGAIVSLLARRRG